MPDPHQQPPWVLGPCHPINVFTARLPNEDTSTGGSSLFFTAFSPRPPPFSFAFNFFLSTPWFFLASVNVAPPALKLPYLTELQK